MKKNVFMWIMAAAILTGAIFGAIYNLVPNHTRSASLGVAMAIDAVAALFAGVVLICFARFVRWIKKREDHNHSS